MPRIYVADLAEYVAGNLVGRWYDPEDFNFDADELSSAVEKQVLRKLVTGHEEWAIHDYEGFGPIRIGEYDSLETVCAHAERLSNGNAGKYAAWINARGESDAENFDPDIVHGPYESESAYVDDYIENCYGSLDLEDIMANNGMDRGLAAALSQLVTWNDTDQIIRDWGNPLTEVSTGEYSREYYEVEG